MNADAVIVQPATQRTDKLMIPILISTHNCTRIESIEPTDILAETNGRHPFTEKLVIFRLSLK
jgi:hypothetical protein